MLPGYEEALTKYSVGRDLLSALLIHRELLLQELERLSRIPQHVTGIIVDFDYRRSLSITLSLVKISLDLHDLVEQINKQAAVCGMPPVHVANLGVN